MLDDPRVSGRHARLTSVAGLHTLIEDTGSSNGTFLNSTDRRVTGPTPISAIDTLYFGTLAVPAVRLLGGAAAAPTPAPVPQRPMAAATLAEPLATVRAQSPSVPSPQSPSVPSPLIKYQWPLAGIAQAPILALVIVAIFGRAAAATDWQSAGQGVAATTFALALAAVWLGGSLAAIDGLTGRLASAHASTGIAAHGRVDSTSHAVAIGQQIAVLAGLSLVAAAILLAIVHPASGLKGPWLPMYGVLGLTSLVGMFLSLAVLFTIRNWVTAVPVLLIGFMAMVAFGGWVVPSPSMVSPLRAVASVMPPRWAFEALFLLEAAERPTSAGSQERVAAERTANQDPVEQYFPADSEQMGPRADVMALGSMLIGFSALTSFLFISGLPRSDR